MQWGEPVGSITAAELSRLLETEAAEFFPGGDGLRVVAVLHRTAVRVQVAGVTQPAAAHRAHGVALFVHAIASAEDLHVLVAELALGS